MSDQDLQDYRMDRIIDVIVVKEITKIMRTMSVHDL